jgi:hypothetical protein
MAETNVRIEWRGEEVRQRVAAAEAEALKETADLAVRHARAVHPGWQSQTGKAEASIGATRPSRQGSRTSARIGFGAPYGRFLEGGARGRRGDRTIKRAAEETLPGLASRIRRRLGG